MNAATIHTTLRTAIVLMLFLALLSVACAPAVVDESDSGLTTTESSVSGEGVELMDPALPVDTDDHQDEEESHDEDDGEFREHGAHEHGAAAITIAWIASEVQIELDSPAFNLFGFEYAPSTDEERQLVDEGVRDLESGEFMVLNVEAGCRLSNSAVETEWEHEDEVVESESGETHSDVSVRLEFICESPEAIQSLDLGPLFTRFPNLEELDAEWISDSAQSATELTAESSLLIFQ